MAVNKSTSRTRNRGKLVNFSPASKKERFDTGVFGEPSITLDETIERERARLMRAESILGCASVAISYATPGLDERQPYYPDVVDAAREMIVEATVRLDSVYLHRLRRRRKCRSRR